MSDLRVGTKVEYRSMMSGRVLGKVQGFGHDLLGPTVIVKVTSRNNAVYPYGMILPLSPGAFLSARP